MKEAYNKLKTKHKLPDYKELDNEFEVSLIEQENFLLRAIIEKITNRIEIFTEILGDILQPEGSSLKSMQESTFFKESEQKNIYEIYKKLMIIIRESNIIIFDRNEKQEAEYITKTNKEWQNIKKDLEPILKKLKESWNSKQKSKLKLGYLG